MALIALVFCAPVSAQAGGTRADFLSLPLRVSVEWHELLKPGAASMLLNDGFKFSGGTENLKLQFSTQAPAVLAGRQLQWLRAGYRIAEAGLSRKWGSIRGFRSFGWNPALVRPGSARSIAGAGAEMRRSLFGMRPSVSMLHASSGKEGGISQLGMALAGEWRSGAHLHAEWSQSWGSPSSTPYGGAAGRGVRGARPGW